MNLEISMADTENAATGRLAAFLTVPCYTLHSEMPVFPGSVLRHDVIKFWSENCKQTVPWVSFREWEQLGEQMMFPVQYVDTASREAAIVSRSNKDKSYLGFTVNWKAERTWDPGDVTEPPGWASLPAASDLSLGKMYFREQFSSMTHSHTVKQLLSPIRIFSSSRTPFPLNANSVFLPHPSSLATILSVFIYWQAQGARTSRILSSLVPGILKVLFYHF